MSVVAGRDLASSLLLGERERAGLLQLPLYLLHLAHGIAILPNAAGQRTRDPCKSFLQGRRRFLDEVLEYVQHVFAHPGTLELPTNALQIAIVRGNRALLPGQLALRLTKRPGHFPGPLRSRVARGRLTRTRLPHGRLEHPSLIRSSIARA